MTTKEILEKNDKNIFNNLNSTQIDMYYSGWECDSVAWVLKDGRIFGTNHGSLVKITKKEFKIYLNSLEKYIKNTKKLTNI